MRSARPDTTGSTLLEMLVVLSSLASCQPGRAAAVSRGDAPRCRWPKPRSDVARRGRNLPMRSANFRLEEEVPGGVVQGAADERARARWRGPYLDEGVLMILGAVPTCIHARPDGMGFALYPWVRTGNRAARQRCDVGFLPPR